MQLQIQDDGTIDLGFVPGAGIVMETGLQTATIISLACDRRAALDDQLPDNLSSYAPLPPDRRGWCGDALAETDGDLIGSRLWLLARRKETEDTRQSAGDYLRESLQWMLDDKVVTALAVDPEWIAMGRLQGAVTLNLPTGGEFSITVPVGGS